jgi:ubiquinone/menaquinone biosynthesis C-methylase UbiE
MTTHSDYEYHGLMAETWDLFRGDTSRWEDRLFYLELVEKYGQPVLDVGCGTGRLLLDFLQQSIDIDGVDNSPEMLTLCRRKAAGLGLQPVLFEQWMESLALPRLYRTILVPSSSFQLILEPELAERALWRLKHHLLPGGALVIPFMILWQPGDPLELPDWKLTAEKTRLDDSVLFRRYSRARYDIGEQLEHTEDRYEKWVDGQLVAQEHHRRSPATRWYTQPQAAALLRGAGFSRLHIYRGFTFEPATPEDTLFTIVCIKM